MPAFNRIRNWAPVVERPGGDGGAICAMREDYHAGKGDFATLVTVRWFDGSQSTHVLEEFEKYGGEIRVLS